MLKINNTYNRNVPEICNDHYKNIRNYILNRLKKSNFNQQIKLEIETRLQMIIGGSPEIIIGQEKHLYKFIYKYRKNKKRIESELKYIFDYSGFVKRSPNAKWSAYKLAKRLKVNTCVYCNRQYTFTIDHNNQKITRPQFDHFFSQSDHPLLGLSFYNLIPSCSICNQRKGDEPFTIQNYLHPYQTGYGSHGLFTFLPHDYKSMIGKSDNLSIKIVESPVSKNASRIKSQKKFFKLEEIYQEHSDLVQEIIWKSHISKGKYFEWLKSLFGKRISNEDIYRIALGNYHNELDMDKRVLSKLTRDIAKELKLVRE